MPLKVVRRRDTGALTILGTVRPAGAPRGVSVRRRAGTDDPQLAAEEAAILEAAILRGAWHGERPATRSFAEAVVSYLEHAPRSDGTKALLRRLVTHFREAPLASITQEAVDRARRAMLRPDASPGTVRRNLIVPLRAVLTHAARRRWCEPPAFDLPPEPKGRTAFLMPAQASALIAAGAHHAPLWTFLVGTGCRLREALTLDWAEVDLAAARVILWEGETKGGARRLVTLPPGVVAALAALRYRVVRAGRVEHQALRNGRVFRSPRGEPYRDSREGDFGGQVRSAWARSCRDAGLADFTPHHLRHTWASWHYALHRDLLRLKIEGGWSSTSQVERYAHIMPSGHEAAIRGVWGLVHESRTKAAAQG